MVRVFSTAFEISALSAVVQQRRHGDRGQRWAAAPPPPCITTHPRRSSDPTRAARSGAYEATGSGRSSGTLSGRRTRCVSGFARASSSKENRSSPYRSKQRGALGILCASGLLAPKRSPPARTSWSGPLRLRTGHFVIIVYSAANGFCGVRYRASWFKRPRNCVHLYCSHL